MATMMRCASWPPLMEACEPKPIMP
jgi:hypothetical protein